MTPGDSRNIDISVSNVKDGRTSEVTQDYSIIINTTGNLPLVYELAQKNSTGAGTYVTTSTIPKSDGNSRAWSGGQMPHSENTVHEYTLTVKWPTNSTDASYADEIDKVTLTVDSKQKMCIRDSNDPISLKQIGDLITQMDGVCLLYKYIPISGCAGAYSGVLFRRPC